jgi:hypothetical protein
MGPRDHQLNQASLLNCLMRHQPFKYDFTLLAASEPASYELRACGDCGAAVATIIGCPDGAEICKACFDAGDHWTVFGAAVSIRYQQDERKTWQSTALHESGAHGTADQRV